MDLKPSLYNIVIKEENGFVFLFNSYSGAFCKIEKNTYGLISASKLECLSTEDIIDLKKQGYLVPQKLNEYNKILLKEREAILDQYEKKRTFVIAPTLACNLNCIYCFENGFRNGTYMDLQTFNKTIIFIKNRTRGMEKVHITWFGGEPLLAFDIIKSFNEKIMPYILEHKIDYTSSMITNGVLLNEDKTKYLFENCNLKSVQITIDGTESNYCIKKRATKDQYRQVLENIKSAIKYIRVNVRLNCDKENYSDLQEVSKNLIKLCGKTSNLDIYLARLIDYDNCGAKECFYNQENFDLKKIEFIKQLYDMQNKKFKLRIPHYSKCFCGLFKLKNLVIGPKGELYKCEHFVGQEEKIIGTIDEGVYYDDSLFTFLENKKLEKCKKCKIFPVCLGGCPANKMALKEEDVCYYSIEYFKQALKLLINE